MPEQFTFMGGKVHVYKRPNSSHWQCSGYFAGKGSADEHEGRQSLESKSVRRGLLSSAPRQTPHRRNQNRENFPRSLRTISS
jgi:hypothetical protein